MTDYLAMAYPRLAKRLEKLQLAKLPTPVVNASVMTRIGRRDVAIKRDDLTGDLYGGNKVRKLEYLLHRATTKSAKRVATFGTVASNHAVATSLYANSLGLECTCLLSNQVRSSSAPRALNVHIQCGTEIIRYGGSRSTRIRILREHLWNRGVFLIPPGGSNWLGAIGFVNAGLELAAQVEAGETCIPDRLYVANGTMATAVGIALGLALSGLPTEVQAVRVTESFVANPAAMRRLLTKTADVLRSLDASVPDDLADLARYEFRDGFLGDGYAKTNSATDHAVRVAGDELGLALETTYTGKAMAAMLQDMDKPELAHQSMLFWNTYNSRPLAASPDRPVDVSRLPPEFLRYFD
jgi:1-aminocyclopropane-1-carboxylate deaminase/D-cysteine desulfhydrase-like pyridoxal-dependent ACC family enzyme